MFNLRKKYVMTAEEKSILKKVLLFYEEHHNIFTTFSNSNEKRQIIKEIYAVLNYNSYPNVHSLLENSTDDGLTVYKGISAANIDLLKSYINDFIYRNIFYGGRASIYGTGIYTVVGNDSSIAQNYASDGGTNTCGVVIESTMQSDTKIINSSKIDEIRNFVFDKIRKIYKQEAEKFLSILEDDGALAAILGYDAIFIEEKKYLVILNRTKMIVNDTNLFEQINTMDTKFPKF